MTVGIENLRLVLNVVTDTICNGVKIVKALPAIKAETADADAGELVALITEVVVQDIPKILAAFRATA